MNTSKQTASTETVTGLKRLYPASIAFLIEERPLLWYEDPEEYDSLQRAFFAQLSPEGVLNCIFIKNVVDYAWEMRRVRKLIPTAINFAMPEAAVRLLAPDQGLWGNSDTPSVRGQAADVAYGAKEDIEEGKPSLAERMEEMRVTPEMIHYKALNSTADRLECIRREYERLESRLHRLLKDYEARNATLVAMAKSLVERERAEVVAFVEGN